MTHPMRACIDVDDMEKGIAFYTQALGLQVGRRLGQDWVELLGAAVPIDLLGQPAGSQPCPAEGAVRDYRRHWTAVHLDFVVDDIQTAVRRAETAGATLERPVHDHAWGREANLADPFGHGFCLLEFHGRGYDEILAASERD